MVTKEERRRQLAREKYERQQRRRRDYRSRARRRNAVIAAVVAVVLAAGAAAFATGALPGKDKDSKTVDAAASSAAATTKAPDPCEKAASGSPATKTWKKEPALTVDKTAKYTFTLQTTCGDIAMALDAAAAPHTVNSFDFLAGEAYFDHTTCHRLTTAGIYVLQCGDPTGQGTGGPGYTIPDENLKAKTIAGGTYPVGTIAMANAGANTGGSQFFLVYQDSPLPASYTPFGTISKAGLKVLDKIAAAGDATGAGDGAPNATVVINKATVTKS